MPPASPDTVQFLPALLTLAALVVGLLLLPRLLKKLNVQKLINPMMSAADKPEIVAMQSLSPRERLLVVRWNGARYLLAVGGVSTVVVDKQADAPLS
jgi:flagellar biogenesis protein FliO